MNLNTQGKKFKNGKAYFFKVKFFYYINSRKKYYKGTGPYKGSATTKEHNVMSFKAVFLPPIH